MSGISTVRKFSTRKHRSWEKKQRIMGMWCIVLIFQVTPHQLRYTYNEFDLLRRRSENGSVSGRA